jgi:GMP synthase (glutamine-hydrolysing)
MILVVNVCKESLHYYEFVAPVLNILSSMGADYFVANYDEVTKDFLDKAEKVIICGTSLYDNQYLEDIQRFSWIWDFDKPILGICAGCQAIQLIYGGRVEHVKEVGSVDIEFAQSFLGMSGKKKVYSLHQNSVVSPEFNIYAYSECCPHAFKHKSKDVYGVLFHPEVYNHEIIESFVKL